MNATSSEQIKVSRSRWRPACFGSPRRYHNPMLVLNMSLGGGSGSSCLWVRSRSIFNSETGWETGWNRIFNPRPSHENVWC